MKLPLGNNKFIELPDIPEPLNPVDGKLWMDTAAGVLKRWEAKKHKWVVTSHAFEFYTRIIKGGVFPSGMGSRC